MAFADPYNTAHANLAASAIIFQRTVGTGEDGDYRFDMRFGTSGSGLAIAAGEIGVLVLRNVPDVGQFLINGGEETFDKAYNYVCAEVLTLALPLQAGDEITIYGRSSNVADDDVYVSVTPRQSPVDVAKWKGEEVAGSDDGVIPAFVTSIPDSDGTIEILTRLPDAAPGASGGLPTTNGMKLNQTVDLTAAAQQGIANAIHGRRTWYVASGGTGDGTSWDSAFGALSDITDIASGDLILVGPGTFAATTADFTAVDVEIRGAGMIATIIQAAAASCNFGACRLRNLTLQDTDAGVSCGFGFSTAVGLVLLDGVRYISNQANQLITMITEGGAAGGGQTLFMIRNSNILHGIWLEDCDQLLIDNSYLKIGRGAMGYACLAGSIHGQCIIRNSALFGNRASGNFAAINLSYGDLVTHNVDIRTEAAGVGNGAVFGIKAGTLGYTSHVTLKGTRINTPALTGCKDIADAGGTVLLRVDAATEYDTAKVTGTVTNLAAVSVNDAPTASHATAGTVGKAIADSAADAAAIKADYVRSATPANALAVGEDGGVSADVSLTEQNITDIADGVAAQIEVSGLTAEQAEQLAAAAEQTTADAIGTAVLDLAHGIENDLTLRHAMRSLVARSGHGKLSGAGSGSEVCYAPDGTTARITFTVDASGNITAVTTNLGD